MLAFAVMLIGAAEAAGIPIPEDPDDFVASEFPQFQVFCNIQLGQAMATPTAHWDNAKVVAKFTPEQCLTVTFAQLLAAGLSIKT